MKQMNNNGITALPADSDLILNVLEEFNIAGTSLFQKSLQKNFLR